MPSEPPTPSRRALSVGVAWSIPAVVIGAPAPAVAMSAEARALSGIRPHGDASPVRSAGVR